MSFIHTHMLWPWFMREGRFPCSYRICLSSYKRMERKIFKNKFIYIYINPQFSLQSHNRTICSKPGVPLSFQFCVCVGQCAVAVVLCHVSGRHNVAEKSHWFSVPVCLSASPFFTIQYDNLLWGSCGTWEKTHSIKLTNSVSADLASFSADTHKCKHRSLVSECFVAMWTEMSHRQRSRVLRDNRGMSVSYLVQ